MCARGEFFFTTKKNGKKTQALGLHTAVPKTVYSPASKDLYTALVELTKPPAKTAYPPASTHPYTALVERTKPPASYRAD
jgi:hypothetical protein